MKGLILFLVILCVSYNASATPINTGAEILTSITVPEQVSFDIGQFSAGVPGSELDFDTGEIISSASGVTLVGGDAVARGVNASASALTTITVTINSIGTTTASGVETLVIVSHCRGPGTRLGADKRNCPLISNDIINDRVTISDKTSQHNPLAVGF